MTRSTSRTAPIPVAAQPSRLTHVRRRLLDRWHYSYAGLAGATVFFSLSLTPSLLPRGAVLQGLISGILTAIGYGVGVLALWIVRVTSTRPLPEPGRTAWRWLAGVAAVAVTVFLYLGSGWQREIHRLMGMDPPSRPGYVIVPVVAVLLATGLVGLCRLLRKAAGALARLLGRWIPARTARVLAGALVVVLTYGVVNGVLIDGFFTLADNSFRAVNGETRPDTNPPGTGLRSGGPGSLVSWKSLGNQGRVFVTGSPDAVQLQQFSGTAPQEPIRVYVGLDSAPTSRDRAALAVGELERTDAFSRKVLWSIEVAFEDARQHTGVGEARNRTVGGVERTVPFGVITQTIVVVWYAHHGHSPRIAEDRGAATPWYRTKTQPSYHDMIIKLRRTLIAAKFRGGSPRQPTPQETLDIQLAWAEAAA